MSCAIIGPWFRVGSISVVIDEGRRPSVVILSPVLSGSAASFLLTFFRVTQNFIRREWASGLSVAAVV